MGSPHVEGNDCHEAEEDECPEFVVHWRKSEVDFKEGEGEEGVPFPLCSLIITRLRGLCLPPVDGS